MPSAYLTLAQAAAYGLTSASSPQIQAASSLLDAYLKRPEGLVWAADSQGQPAYMAALAPSFTFTLGAAISPGTNVSVNLTGPTALLNVGDVLVLDQPTANLTEAVVIASLSGVPVPTTIILQSVVNAHSQNAPAAYGLVIEEKRQMPADRPITFSSRTPLLRLISGVGRYGYGRRGDGADYNMEQFNLLAALSKFGGPPVWELWQQPLINSIDPTTGQIWAPAGIMLAYYSEVKFRYVAGFQQTALPPVLQLATANIMQAAAATANLGNVKSFKAGDTSMTRFAASLLDADTRQALRPYMARAYL